MQIKHERRDGILIVSIDGRIDSITTPTVEATLHGLVKGADDRVVIDMSGVDFINSAGLSALLKATRLVSGSTGGLVLSGLQVPVQHVLELAGIGKRFVTEPSLPRALARFQA